MNINGRTALVTGASSGIEIVLKASIAANPKTGGYRASRLQFLRTFAPAGMVDAGIRKNLHLAVA